MLLDAGAECESPSGLFRNIWDSDELNKLVQTSGKYISTLGSKDKTKIARLRLFNEAAIQFDNMGQRSSAEGMYRKTLREIEKLHKGSRAFLRTTRTR